MTMAALGLPCDILHLLFAAILLGLTTYIFGTWNYDYFSRRKLPFIPPFPFLGNMLPFVLGTSSFPDLMQSVYRALKGRAYGGIFEFLKPVLVVCDPELISKMMVNDRDRFVDRTFPVPQQADPMFVRSLFELTGKRRKNGRFALDPTVISSTMEKMFLLVSDCGQKLGTYLEKQCHQHRREMMPLDVREMFTTFTSDVTASTVLGVSCNSASEETKRNTTRLLVKMAQDFPRRRLLLSFGYILSPRFMAWLDIPVITDKEKDFFRSLVRDSIALREREGIIRPDLIHLLMQARRGELEADSGEEPMNTEADDDDDLVAQAVVFFLSCFHTCVNLLSFAVYQLVLHQDIQQRLQAEIDGVLEEQAHENTVTYQDLQRMKYLDMVILETLRLFPPMAYMEQRCVKPYTVNGTGSNPAVTLKKGDTIWIPIFALHRDPSYFPEPRKFDPERFSDDNKCTIKPFTFLPFGAGPRDSIGQRLAVMEAKMALVSILSRFSLHIVDRTRRRLKFSKKCFSVTLEGRFWVGIRHRKA